MSYIADTNEVCGKQLKVKVIANKKIAEDCCKLSVNSAYLARRSEPGQFVNVRCSEGTEPLLRRPFGVHKINKNGIEILYKVVGKGTELLSRKKAGGILDLIGPLGNGFSYKPTAQSPQRIAHLIAGGHGVAPLYELARQIRAKGGKVEVFLGAKNKRRVFCDKDFRKLGAKVYIATEDGSRGRKGLVTELVMSRIRSTVNHERLTVYACGPKAMLKEVAKIAGKRKIPCQVSMEEYFGCGTGICMGCAVKTRAGTKLVCKDGPIFNAEEIIW